MLVADALAGRREHGHGERRGVKDAAEAYRYGYPQRGGRDGMTVVAAPTGVFSILGGSSTPTVVRYLAVQGAGQGW